jgi:Heterokaryon incompatibility protein (HET)/NACHT domain
MHLLKLDGNGDISLTKDFIEEKIPPYAILSHTWGDEDEEVTFQDMKAGVGNKKIGFKKIEYCRKQAALHDLRYFWVDTCCIDQSNSAQLTEAINSMFSWYQKSEKCYVYLSDVSFDISHQDYQNPKPEWQAAFKKSRWFTRGWTLQELIAPKSVEFFSLDWKRLGDKRSLQQQIHDVANIPIPAILGETLSQFDITERFRWSEKRETKRQEDKAYCLLGIFDIHMPLIYGEGKAKALNRLNEEIKRGSKPDRHPVVQNEEHKAVIDWLSNFDFPSQQSDIISCRESGTGLWFLESQEFTEWLLKSRGTLFCEGIPGAGKTMMAAIAIDHIMAFEGNSVGLSYIFCNYKAKREQTTASLLAAILKQLVRSQPTITEPISGLYKTHKNRGTRPSLEEIYSTLQALMKTFTHVYIVVDALDECSSQDGTRSQLFSKLRSLQQEFDVRLMITSRPGSEAIEVPSMSLLEVRASEADVKRFLEGQLYRLPNCIQRDPELQGLVKDNIVAAADGM